MLLLMRHGQASFNAAHYDQLSPLGEAQARITGRYMRERAADCSEVCIGPRQRHRGTAAGLLAGWDITPPQRHVEALDEFTSGLRMSHVLQRDGSEAPDAVPEEADAEARLGRLMERIGAWAAGALVLPGCPTLVDFRQRVGAWLRSELAVARPGPPVVAVTSGGTIAAAVCEVLGLPDSMFLAIVSQVQNASLTQFGLARGVPVLASFNSTGHLPPGMLTTV